MKVSERFKIAGYELTKANFGNVIKSLTAPTLQMSDLITSYNYRGGDGNDNGFWMFNVNGNDRFFSTTDSSLTGYKACPPISAIISQKAQGFINGQTYVMNASGSNKGKESTTEQGRKIRRLLVQPNPQQSGDHFEMQVYINTMIFGYTVILPVKPVGYENFDAKYLWAIPGNMVEIEETEDLFFSYTQDVRIIKSITLVYKKQRTQLNPDDVFIIKDSTPSFNSIAIPDSRITTLTSPINNIIGAMESRGSLIANRGPRFVVSNAAKDVGGTIPMTPREKADVEENFKQSYGLLRQQSHAIITSAALNVNTIGFDVKQLGLMEEVQESSSMLCMGLGFPKFLAGLSDPTFNNQGTAEKALYQRFIIPESKSIYGQWNKFFNTEKYNLNIEKDYSQLPVLQEDMMNLGRARYYMNQGLVVEWYNNIITANEWLQANGLDTKDGFDVYYDDWIRSGKNFGITPSGTQAPNNTSIFDTQTQTNGQQTATAAAAAN